MFAKVLVLILSLSHFSFAQSGINTVIDAPEVYETEPHTCLGKINVYGIPNNLTNQLVEFEAILSRNEPRQLQPWLQKNLQNWEAWDLYLRIVTVLNPPDRTDFLREIINFKAQTAKPPGSPALYNVITKLIACNRTENLSLILSKPEFFFGGKLTADDLFPHNILYTLGPTKLNLALGKPTTDSLLKRWQRPSVYKSIQECQSVEKVDFKFSASEVVRGKVLAVNRLAKLGVVALSVEVLENILGSNKTGSRISVMWPEIDREFGAARNPPAIGSDIFLPLRKLTKDWPYFSQCPLFYSDANRIAWLNRRPKTLMAYSKKDCKEEKNLWSSQPWIDVVSESVKIGGVTEVHESIRFFPESGPIVDLKSNDVWGEGATNYHLNQINCQSNLVIVQRGGWESSESLVYSTLNGNILVEGGGLELAPDQSIILSSRSGEGYEDEAIKLFKIKQGASKIIWDEGSRKMRRDFKDGKPRFSPNSVKFILREIKGELPKEEDQESYDHVYKINIIEVSCTLSDSTKCVETIKQTTTENWKDG